MSCGDKSTRASRLMTRLTQRISVLTTAYSALRQRSAPSSGWQTLLAIGKLLSSKTHRLHTNYRSKLGRRLEASRSDTFTARRKLSDLNLCIILRVLHG